MTYFPVALAADSDPAEGLEKNQSYKQCADECYRHQQEHLRAQAQCAADLRHVNKTHRIFLRGSRYETGSRTSFPQAVPHGEPVADVSKAMKTCALVASDAIFFKVKTC